jgi:hypothetical protein
MSTPMIIPGYELCAESDVYYTKAKINGSGGKNVGILNTKCNKSLFITTPLMLTWGINENDFDNTGKKTYDFSLQFPRESDVNSSDDMSKMLKNLTDFENKIKVDAITYAKEWFNKPKMTEDVVEALWTPMLKYPKNQETGEPDTSRSPTLRVKIPYYDEVFKIELYDTERIKIFPDTERDDITPMSLVEKGQNMAVVIQNGGIWFANGKFGTTWKLIQAVVQPRESLYGKCHISLKSDEKTRLKKEAEELENTEVVNSTNVNDSDDEEVMGVEEEKSQPVVDEEVLLVTEETPAVAEEPVKKVKKSVKKKLISKD